MEIETRYQRMTTEWFYTMKSVTHGEMTVACEDYELMVADRESALADPDKSNISALASREVPELW